MADTAPRRRSALRRFRTRTSRAAAQASMILLRFRRHDLALVAGSVHRWSAARNPYTEPSPTRQTDPVCRLLFVARAHSDLVFHRPFSGHRESDSAATEPSVGPKECPSIQVRQQRRVIWLISSSRRFTMRYVQFQQTYVDRDCTLLAWEPLDNLRHLAEHAHGGSAMDSVPARSAAEAAEPAEGRIKRGAREACRANN
jgi:hypothetical protein